MLTQLKLRRLSAIAPDPITPERFKLARERLRWNYAQTGDFLWVTEKTIRNWEAGRVRIPYSAFRLLRLRSGYSVMTSGWESWSFGHKGELVSPAGRVFTAKDLEYIGFIFAQARLWREGVRNGQKRERSTALPVDAPPLVTRGESK